jgi:hypothetical protein
VVGCGSLAVSRSSSGSPDPGRRKKRHANDERTSYPWTAPTVSSFAGDAIT